MSMKKILILSSLLTLSELSLAQDKKDYLLIPEKIETKIKKEIADLDINFNVKLLDLELSEGISVSSRYKYEVEPSYLDQYFTRVDRWRTKIGVNVGDVADGLLEDPFHFGISRESDIFFVRQFKDKKEAMKATPYTLAKLPINSKLALKNLAVGDFVAIPANLTLSIGAGATSNWLTGPIGVEAVAGVNYVVSGEFTLHIFRVDEKRVRVKILSKRGYEKKAGINVNAAMEIFGVDLLNKAVNKLYDTELGSIYGGVHPGGQFVVDYVFDLSDADARKAYDNVLSSSYKFNELILLNKIGNGGDLKERIVSTYELADKLYLADKKNQRPRVQRIFKGFNNFDGTKKGFKVGVILASVKKDFTYTESMLSMIDENEQTHEFYYPLNGEFREQKIGGNIVGTKEQINKNYFSLLPTNKDETVHADFGLTYERRDKNFTESEQRAVYKFIRAQLPEEIKDKILLNEWYSTEAKTDVRILYQIILKDQAFDYLKTLTVDQINENLTVYVRDRRKVESNDEDSLINRISDWFFVTKEIQADKVEMLSIKLHDIFTNPEYSNKIRAKMLVQLRNNGIFEKVGAGFLASMLPKHVLKEGAFVNLEMIGDKLPKIDFKYGELTYKELYSQLNSIQMRLSNRSYDLRLESLESEKEANQ